MDEMKSRNKNREVDRGYQGGRRYDVAALAFDPCFHNYQSYPYLTCFLSWFLNCRHHYSNLLSFLQLPSHSYFSSFDYADYFVPSLDDMKSI
jgi:hypothetical protein